MLMLMVSGSCGTRRSGRAAMCRSAGREAAAVSTPTMFMAMSRGRYGAVAVRISGDGQP